MIFILLMILISHRGNINQINSKYENSPEYVMEACMKGYDVEIDVWFYKNCFYLGHDEPQYKIKSDFLTNSKFWCHAKNSASLEMMSKLNCHFFWHNIDDYTITSKGFVWIYPGKKLLKKGICVLPEISNYKKIDCLGVCSDMIEQYKND